MQRLEQRVAEGDYYEALQLYKTSYSRFKAQGKVEDAEELLVTGAIAMSQEKEVSTLLVLMVSVNSEWLLVSIIISDCSVDITCDCDPCSGLSEGIVDPSRSTVHHLPWP